MSRTITGTKSKLLLLALGYAALLAYGTLYPFADWSTPDYNITARMLSEGLSGSLSDIVVNFLVYLPFGLLFFKGLPARWSSAVRLLVVTVVGAAISYSLECGQAYMPARVPSLLDLFLNTASALAGGLLALLSGRDTRVGARLHAWRQQYFKSGPEGTLGLFVVGFWSLSQLTPLVPSLDVGLLWDGIKPLWLTITGDQPFITAKALTYACQIAAVSLLLECTLRHQRGHGKFLPILILLSATLALKMPVMSRAISLEALAGLFVGLLLLPLTRRARRRDRTYAAVFFILVAVATETLRAPTAPSFYVHAFNWIPFRGHLSNELIGFGGILESVWPFLALSLAIQLSYRRKPPWYAPYVGGTLVFVFVFTLEWLQQRIPGRYPDITTAILALMAWTAPWVFATLNTTRRFDANSQKGGRHDTRPLMVASLIAGLTLAVGLVSLAAGPTSVMETRVDQSKQATHAAPGELPPVDLPGFRFLHPRLPAPSIDDIRRLYRDNPGYLAQQKKAARGGSGDIMAAVRMAYIEPGSIDLAKLHRKLIALKFQWRGNVQGKPLAIAYDWLYDQWSDQQREQLADKLLEGGAYLIERIRSTRLSPYNVYLYNSPFQALMAVTLAIYGDRPEAGPIMNFTADFWKNRILPVWRQIMGTNGGWHEGGEYVGIGIGQAVYQLPAMWRSATGEDFFGEAGIRGFLDFLVYRTRPDGTHMRWGDGTHHDRMVLDRVPLAIELRHAAAYSLNGCPKRIEPTAWPWGPLPDPSLCDPNAIERMPLTHYFDGIGLLVARSGWDATATYLTFKAGDNYWSHTHLDQGAFTIYKGGALAIDSGIYGGGSGYGSDHHLNYSYQTVAHNVVTVTAPADTVPKPEEKGPPRAIANDGGQRRVGSGWGVESAPLDLAEWQRKKEIYHTGSMLKLVTEPDLIVAVADLAPAYTNRLSGKGTFSHRERRVDAYVRTLGFDAHDEVVVIHDRVKATHPEFAKNWLIHTLERPQIRGSAFTVRLWPSESPERSGGSLHGTVLLPKEPYLNPLGGRSFEFFVDGVNYDNEGAVEELVKKRREVEPGAWRIALSPTMAAREDRFLVVLVPKTSEDEKQFRIRLVEEGSRYGAEIVGPTRTTVWWFDSAHDGPVVDVTQGAAMESRDFRVAEQPDLESATWFKSMTEWLVGFLDQDR